MCRCSRRTSRSPSPAAGPNASSSAASTSPSPSTKSSTPWSNPGAGFAHTSGTAGNRHAPVRLQGQGRPPPEPREGREGKTKSRLEPNGKRSETVTQIALWRYHEGLGYNTIADRLNADLERYPPPVAPSKSRARGAWSESSVYGVLCNPKYTGYQVFNRRATTSKRGKVNEPYKWAWSPKPIHEPLIPKWMLDELNGHRAAKRGSRADGRPNTNPSAERTSFAAESFTAAAGAWPVIRSTTGSSTTCAGQARTTAATPALMSDFQQRSVFARTNYSKPT